MYLEVRLGGIEQSPKISQHTSFVSFLYATGVIFTRADNEDINSLDDLKDRIVGALAISDFAGGQVQFFVMREAGIDFIMAPKQVIFTGMKQKC